VYFNMKPDSATNADEDEVPYKDFLHLLSFIAAVGAGLALVGSLTLACAASFLGLTDSNTLAYAKNTAVLFTWATSTYGVALFLSLAGQLLITGKGVLKALQDKSSPLFWVKTVLALIAWLSLGFVVAATALTGEGLKSMDGRAGAMLEWALLIIGVLILAVWIGILAQQRFLTQKKVANDDPN
jgi:hypothetical protein